MVQKKIYHLWNIYSSEKEKKLSRNYNYYDKCPEKGNRETHTWASNIGYCVQEKLQIRYNIELRVES